MNTIQKIMAFLSPFTAVIENEALALEGEGVAELETLIQKVSSPDLKVCLEALKVALDSIAQTEIKKLG